MHACFCKIATGRHALQLSAVHQGIRALAHTGGGGVCTIAPAVHLAGFLLFRCLL